MPKARGLWGAIGLFAGLLIVAFVAAPRVAQYSPRSDSPHVSSSAPIRISFSRRMDRLSVEARLSVSPEVPGQFSWSANTLSFEPAQPWTPGSTVTVSLQAGARSAQFIPILTTTRWSFEVGQPRLSYLWPSDGAAGLYVYDLITGQTDLLAESQAGVLDYTVAGNTLVYAELTEDGASRLLAIDLTSGEPRLLWECPASQRCESPALNSNGNMLAYEQFEWQTTASGQRVPGPSEIRLLPLDEAEGQQGDSAPATLAAAGQSLETPLWSPSGNLAYYNATLGAVSVIQPGSELPLTTVPNGLGLLGGWSPDGRHLALPEIGFPDSEQSGGVDFYSHLYQVDTLSGEVTELSQGPVEDASPSYSPDGAWIAFARKYLDQRWTPGRQLWLMRADGTQARQLTDDPDYSHSALSWSPDSTRLVYMQLSQVDPNLRPQIWITDLAGEGQQMLVEGGYLPQWLP